MDDQPRALRELRRVLRPGGQLLFIEHVRSGDPGGASLQDRMNWLNRLLVCCDCNRPTLDSIREAGFTPPRSPREAVLTNAAVAQKNLLIVGGRYIVLSADCSHRGADCPVTAGGRPRS